MNKLGRFVVVHPKLVIAATLAITIALGSAILARGLGFDGSLETLSKKDTALEFYNQIRSIFGDDRVIIVALTGEDVFTEEFIARLDRLTRRLAAIGGVQDAQSLTNIKAVKSSEGGLVVENLIPRSATTDGLASLKASVAGDPLYSRNLISPDGKTAAINVFLSPLGQVEIRRVADEVERVARSEAAGDELLLAGAPIMDARGIRSMVRDMLICSPVAAVLCFIVFFFAFRSLRAALLPMSALLMGLIWVLGLMSLAGHPITISTLSLPTVLMAVGGSYMFHVLNQYRLSMPPAETSIVGSRRFGLDDHSGGAAGRTQEACRSETGRQAAWVEGLRFILPAVLVSGLATVAGFGSLASSAIPTARDMGVFDTLGVLAMLLLTLTFVPAALSLLPGEALGRSRGPAMRKILTHLTAVTLFRRREVWVISIGLTLIVGAGLVRLQVNTDYLKMFPRSSPTVQAAEKLHERLSGAATVQLVVSGGRGAIYDPDFLGSVESIERFALGLPGVDSAISVADIVKRVNGLLDPGVGPAGAIPADRSRIEGIFRDLLSNEESISRLVDIKQQPPGTQAIIILRTNLFSSNELRALTTSIDRWAGEHLRAGVRVRATGLVVLLDEASDAVAASQLSSLAIALASIYLMMVVLFRSAVTGLVALIPNLLPIAGFFGFLGWTGIPLDITTSLVATSALGLAVDNAVHMIRRYRQCSAEARDEGWAMWLAMSRTGRPMILANVMLIAAFLVFMISSFVPVRLAGLLWAVTITACLAADLLFLPVLMKFRVFSSAALGGAGSSGPRLEPHYSDAQSTSE